MTERKVYLVDDARADEPGLTAIRECFPQAETLIAYKLGDGRDREIFVYEDERLFEVAAEIVDNSYYCDFCELPNIVCACDEGEYNLDFVDRSSQDFNTTLYREPPSLLTRLFDWLTGRR